MNLRQFVSYMGIIGKIRTNPIAVIRDIAKSYPFKSAR